MNNEKLKYLLLAILAPLFVIAFIFLIKWIIFPSANETSAESINVYQDPLQTVSKEYPFKVKISGYTFLIDPLADYDISALVVSKKKYFRGIDADIVPLDLGVCWGDVAKPENLKAMRFRQYLRFLVYQIKGNLPFGYDYIGSHAGNIHIVPANKRIRKVALALKKNDKVRLIGHLISIHSMDYKYVYTRSSSLTREDTGDGACEVMWVKKIHVNNKVYY